ncbi:MAG: thioredoxin domain-containing protein [Jaaginema sp. PMC 1079.18]|nr:thioredoxin domain-containing protein [Jaaginema sp. PMC 1080.18]MEC4849662.1 thioredoxin domain-containing protein [Jaaginema sp. PMC 1079.18]MEC4866078.1 thioredoxin domain-containing protein [Jaaginema sp. PMC 1078.18]
MPIPIPAHPAGFSQGNINASLHIDIFLDIQCPFSRKAWPTILKIVKLYQDKAYFTFYPMTLPNHRQSWDATKAAVAFSHDNTEEFIQFYDYLYNHQNQLQNSVFEKRTQVDLYELLAEFAADCGDRQPENFIQTLKSEAIYEATKIPMRIAFSRGVWSTPTFFINEAEVTELSSSATVEDWQKLLDDLL